MQLNKVLVGALAFLLALPSIFFVAWLALGYDAQFLAIVSAIASTLLIFCLLFRELLYQKKIGEAQLAPSERHSFVIEGPFDFERVRIVIHNRDFLVGARDYLGKERDVTVRVSAGEMELEHAQLSFVQRNGAAAPPNQSWNNQILWDFPIDKSYWQHRETLIVTVENLRHRANIKVYAGTLWGSRARADQKSASRSR